MKKGQGLPLRTVVVGALVLLVLVLVSGFFIPGVGNMFSSILNIVPSGGQNMTYSTFRSKCQSYCSTVQASFTSATQEGISNTQYCNYNASVQDQGVLTCREEVSCEIDGEQVICETSE